jgi:cytochrome P450
MPTSRGLHAARTHLRAHAPVSLVDSPPYRSFWAITKHADIMEIERANDLFADEPRPLLATAQADDMARRQLDAGMGLRTLIHMDDPRGPREGRGLVPPEGDDGRP